MDGTPGDDGDGDRRERARRLAAGSHESVTEELLLGEGRFSATFYLYGAPVVSHLDEGEQPHFAFYNEMKGVGVHDRHETYSPDSNGLTVALVTDRRVLCLVGQADGDYSLDLRYDILTGIEYVTDTAHNRLVVETVEKPYHVYVNRRFDESDLREAVTFVRERVADPMRLVEDHRSRTADADAEGSVASDGGKTDAPGSRGTTDDAGGPEAGGTDDPSGTDAAGVGPDPGDDAAGAGADADDANTEWEPVEGEGVDPLERIDRLHELKKAGAISEADYERKKNELLDRI